MQLINWLYILALKETTSIQVPTNTKFSSRYSMSAKLSLNKSKDKPNKRNLVQEKMLKLSNRLWKTNSTIKIDRPKRFVLLSRREELLLARQSLIIFEVRLPNGKSGILISKSLRRRIKMTRKAVMRRNKRSLLKQEEDTLLLSKDVWRLWKEWSDKMSKTKNTMTTNTIGKKERKLRVYKDSFFPFGGWAIRRKRNMSLPYHGIPSTRICLLFHLEAMTSQSKKLVKF